MSCERKWPRFSSLVKLDRSELSVIDTTVAAKWACGFEPSVLHAALGCAKSSPLNIESQHAMAYDEQLPENLG